MNAHFFLNFNESMWASSTPMCNERHIRPVCWSGSEWNHSGAYYFDNEEVFCSLFTYEDKFESRIYFKHSQIEYMLILSPSDPWVCVHIYQESTFART
jgi:hypothetical protein